MRPSTPFHDAELKEGESVDLFLDGRLRLIQSKRGYRFSIDAVFLAQFVSLKENEVVVELGTGCGIILLMLLSRVPLRQAIGIEVQEELASQAMRNARLNRFQDRMSVLTADLKACPLREGCANLVVSNPPYRRPRSGRINPDPQRAIARHEILASLGDVLKTARYLLRPKGRVAVVYPAERLVDVISQMRRLQLEPKRIQVHYPTVQAGGKLVLVEAILGGRPGVEIEPPLIGQGDFSIPCPT